MTYRQEVNPPSIVTSQEGHHGVKLAEKTALQSHNLSTWEAEAGESQVQSHLWLCEFKAHVIHESLQ